jgi:hypothetical protein
MAPPSSITIAFGGCEPSPLPAGYRFAVASGQRTGRACQCAALAAPAFDAMLGSRAPSRDRALGGHR